MLNTDVRSAVPYRNVVMPRKARADNGLAHGYAQLLVKGLDSFMFYVLNTSMVYQNINAGTPILGPKKWALSVQIWVVLNKSHFCSMTCVGPTRLGVPNAGTIVIHMESHLYHHPSSCLDSSLYKTLLLHRNSFESNASCLRT